MEENNESLDFGTKVEIAGRTMLRPGFSLVGLTGMVYLTLENTPEGCQTILVDWLKHGYTPEAGYPTGSLPLLVNVPRSHLSLEITEEKAEVVEEKPEKKPFAPKLRVGPEVKSSPLKEKQDEPRGDSDSDGEKPKLRLV